MRFTCLQQPALLVDLVEQVVHVAQRGRQTHSHLQFAEFAHQLFGVWQKLMQRRIEQANRYRQSGHLAKDADEVAALQRQQFFERLLARADAFGQNHLAHRREPLIAEEHVLGATKPDSFGAKLARHLRIARRVGIGAHAQPAKLVGPHHQLVKLRTERRLHRRHLAQKHAAGRTIDSDPFAFGDDCAVNGELLLAVIDIEANWRR